ncbi:MAG: ATP-binding cassette domain-containing protein, partial [Erysipelotrichaceae bacterium]|nr:ATP-binding cassette domain-containing protein [Erysipelotrichaceae bacterium]
GSGKTTLLKKIYELMKGLEGVSIGYMPQNYDELLDNEITPIEYLWDGRKREELGKVRSFLGALRFTSEEMEHKIKELSEGQKCKILLVKMILSGNEVLLLDEPTRNLSPLSGPKIRQILCDFKGTIISISHDRKFIEEVADKVYELKDGRLRLLD